MVFEAKSKKKTDRSLRFEERSAHRFLLFYCWKLLLFFHEMRNHAIAAKGVVLIVNVLHHLSVGNRVKTLPHVSSVPLKETITQKRHHRLTHGLLLGGALANVLQLPAVLPCDYAKHLYAKLLYPVFFDNF